MQDVGAVVEITPFHLFYAHLRRTQTLMQKKTVREKQRDY